MSSKNPLTELTTTHYEKVLTALNEIKHYLQTIPNSSLFISKLNFVISTITSYSLYNYDFSHQKDLIDKYQKEIPEFKHLIEYLTDWNEQFTLRKNEVIKKTAKFVESNPSQEEIEELGLQTPSSNVKRKKPANIIFPKKYEIKPFFRKKAIVKPIKENYIRHKSVSFIPNDNKTIPETILLKESKEKDSYSNCFDFTKTETKLTLSSLREMVDKGLLQPPDENKIKQHHKTKQHTRNNHLYESNTIPKSNSNSINSDEDDEIMNLRAKDCFSEGSRNKYHRKANSFNSPISDAAENVSEVYKILTENNYDIKSILSVKFNIFELKDLIGYNNVLPLVGKVLFDYFNFNDKIINIDKLDSFLYAISSTYHSNVLYHNAIHGADVTQTVSLIIMNSNFEELAFTNINDILSIITACLGHDLGHPGLNNNFQINSLSDIAITYNDVSVLENYHTASLFKILQRRENNIFEKFTDFDFRSLRKRIISQILATDMMNHGKVLGVIKTKVNVNQLNKKGENSALVIKNSKNIFQEQEELFDFVVHASDIAHNAKEFKISLKWVELLSHEFWGQGDKEKMLGIPVSFLCDRNDINIPKSQVGFIKAFICPVFELLKEIFPTLDFFLENANKNLDQWNQLVEQKRSTGFTPERKECNNRITVNRNNSNKTVNNVKNDSKKKKTKSSTNLPGFNVKKKKVQGLFNNALVIIE